MKKLIVAFAILVSTISFAQPGNGKREKDSPEQNVEKHLKEMTADLNLAEKQQSEIKTILLEQSKKREANRAEMKSNREKGEMLSDEEKAEMKKKIIDEQLEVKTKMKSILNEDQLKKLQETHKERKAEIREKRNKKNNILVK